jgi:L-gulonate 3-dehydrogenase
MKVSIIGSGTIGLGWALVFSRAGNYVKVYDVDQARLDLFWIELLDRLNSLNESDLLDEDIDVLMARISSTLSLGEAVKDSDFIQECAPEKIELKAALFRSIEGSASDDAIIASSSSALKVSSFASNMRTRGRCIVVHPGNPPYLLTVCEVVPAEFTRPEIVSATIAFLEDCGLRPILVKKEIEGFVFNRLQGALLREAYALVRDGVVEPMDIDLVMTEGLGKRWAILGPFGTSALNVQGGIRAHAARMGESYYRMGVDRGQDDPWTLELVNKVANEVEPIFRNEDWAANVRLRDKALMEITKLMKESRFFKFYGHSS